MNDTPKRRLLDRNVNTPSLIGVGSRIDGELNCPGDLAVAGTVMGNGEIGALFTLSDTGTWLGQLNCDNAVIAGKIKGDIVVRKKLEIRSSARIEGRIAAQHVAIAQGAVVEGELQVLSGEPVQHFAEKRELTPEPQSNSAAAEHSPAK
ncbi:MAG TPA: polymer-forming cytoskeletal protein [Steroidobacteraceae bacterium]|nr:polymer-forming cytoskeletal protein [Steroidobacteraceae bacterium]